MADFMHLLYDVATPIKAAWILWAAWAVAQFVWYRRARFALPQSAPTSASWPPRERQRQPAAKAVEPVAPKPPPTETAKTFDGGFISLGLDERQLPDIELPVV